MTNEPPRRHPRLARALAVVVIAAVAIGAAACGGSKKKSAGTATTGTVVTIKDFAFSPTPLKAKTGATITVKNSDSTTHTFTADDNSFDTGDVAGGASATVTLPGKAATVTYHCNIHSTMKGTIQVTA